MNLIGIVLLSVPWSTTCNYSLKLIATNFGGIVETTQGIKLYCSNSLIKLPVLRILKLLVL